MEEHDGLSTPEKFSWEEVSTVEEKSGSKLESKLVKGEAVFIDEELLFVFFFN
jgi:hypothetical protein